MKHCGYEGCTATPSWQISNGELEYFGLVDYACGAHLAGVVHPSIPNTITPVEFNKSPALVAMPLPTQGLCEAAMLRPAA